MKRLTTLKLFKWLQIMVVLCLAAVVALMTLQTFLTPPPAVSQQDSRIPRLESEVFSLRSQLSRIESQVNRLSNRLDPQNSRSDRPEVVQEPLPPQPVKPTDPMFDRLANLVVDLKDRVNKIENRLSRLESP